jgi:hypothetical protein
MRIIVGGVISLSPFSPGIVWDWLQYAVGLQRLGHDVYYVEEVEPRWCVDAAGQPCPFEASVNRELFRTTMERFGLADRACQLYDRGAASFGMSRDAIARVAQTADVLINISGHVKSDFLLEPVGCRAYVDQDPVYTQLWRSEYGKPLNFDAHDVFFTVGLNIGTPFSPIPDGGVQWHGLLPPVVIDLWPFRVDARCASFTTVASWGGYYDLCFRGEWYGDKTVEFRRFIELPRRVDQQFEVALRRHTYETDAATLRSLLDAGWVVSNATDIRDLAAYQSHIAGSRAEIGIARNAYVRSRSGWFSDRASHYLASGKPVLAQSTGFEHSLPTGRGLLTFATIEQAVEGVRRINEDYEAHCRAARAFAQEYLNYDRVLPRMLDLCSSPAWRSGERPSQHSRKAHS